MANQIYPKHIYEPMRIKIAAQLMQKELRKLLPSVPEKLRPQLDNDVGSWLDGTKSELAPVHDFWNGLEGLMQGSSSKECYGLLRPKMPAGGGRMCRSSKLKLAGLCQF